MFGALIPAGYPLVPMSAAPGLDATVHGYGGSEEPVYLDRDIPSSFTKAEN